MPAIVARSISILSDAGLGMAMFSLGKLIINLINDSVYETYPGILAGKTSSQFLFFFWLDSSQQAEILGGRFIHGTSAKDYCMWKHNCDLCHGSSLPNGSCGDGCCLNCCGVERCSSAHSYCAGNSSLLYVTKF